MPQRLERGRLVLGRQTEPLEPVDKVVREQEQMEVFLVGQEVARRDAAERVFPLEVFDDQLHTGPIVVEPPEVQGLEREVRDEDLVVIFAELEQRQLGGRLLGLGAPDHHEAIQMNPPGGLVAELDHLDPGARMRVPQVGQLALDGPGRRATITNPARWASICSMSLWS